MAMVKKCTDNKNRFLKVSWIQNVLEFGSNQCTIDKLFSISADTDNCR